jgi:hypothetical protein
MPGLPLATVITLPLSLALTDNELDFVQGNTKNLTGKLKTQVIGHGARTNNVNTLEGCGVRFVFLLFFVACCWRFHRLTFG